MKIQVGGVVGRCDNSLGHLLVRVGMGTMVGDRDQGDADITGIVLGNVIQRLEELEQQVAAMRVKEKI